MYSAGGFGVASLVSSFMPLYTLYAVTLVFVGFRTVSMLTTANGLRRPRPTQRYAVASSRSPWQSSWARRPSALPIIGWVATAFGPRTAIQVGAAVAGLVACAIGATWMLSSPDACTVTR